MRNRKHFEEDDTTFPEDTRYSVKGHGGIAFYVLGWETEPDHDTEWTGLEERTGSVLAVMVGDDHRWSFDADDLTAIPEDDYCHECGQIGCTGDGRDRGAA